MTIILPYIIIALIWSVVSSITASIIMRVLRIEFKNDNKIAQHFLLQWHTFMGMVFVIILLVYFGVI